MDITGEQEEEEDVRRAIEGECGGFAELMLRDTRNRRLCH